MKQAGGREKTKTEKRGGARGLPLCDLSCGLPNSTPTKVTYNGKHTHMVLFVMHLDIDTKRHPVVHSCYSCGAAFSVTEAHLQYMPE